MFLLKNKILKKKFGKNNGQNEAGRLFAVFVFLIGLVLVGAFLSPAAELAQNHLTFKIKIFGNRHVSSSALKKGWPAQAGPKDSTALTAFLKNILATYHEKGYYFARVDSFRLKETKSERQLKIWIWEGKRLRVKRIAVTGNRTFTNSNILSRMETRPGHVFYPNKLRSDLQTLLNRYAEKGFPLADVRVVKFRVDSLGANLWLTLAIREGPKGQLNSVQIHGNKVTRTKTILRELGLRPGTVFSRRKLKEIPIRLRRLPFLHLTGEVKVRWDSSGSGKVVIPVREDNMAHFDGTVGYNPPRGATKGNFTGLIDVSFQNLFGTGRTFSAFWQKKEAQSQEIRLFYKEPWILNRPVNGTVSFEQRLQDSTYIRRAWSVGLDFRWLENFQLLAHVGREAILPDSIGSILLGIQKSRALRLSAGVQFDSRDDWLNPRAGIFYKSAVTFLGRRTAASRQNVRRTSLDFEGYWNWFGRQVWALQLHGRDVRFPGGAVPLEEQFFLGGSRTLRGYREDQFRASRLAWSNWEYRYLLGPKSRVFLFLDAGWLSQPKKESHQTVSFFKLGYGFGLRLQTALGVVGLDYGLGQGDAPTQGKIHLRLINQF